jgi:hypothetical protein
LYQPRENITFSSTCAMHSILLCQM